jgi:hypothetical protein
MNSSSSPMKPGGELERGTIMPDCVDHQMSRRGPSQTLLSITTVHHKGVSHPPESYIIKGQPTKIQQDVGTEQGAGTGEMSEANGKARDGDPENPLHTSVDLLPVE